MIARLMRRLSHMKGNRKILCGEKLLLHGGKAFIFNNNNIRRIIQ